MAWLRIIVLLVLAIFAPIAAGRVLPWWGLLLILAAETVLILTVGPALLSDLIKQRLARIFREKSRVLEGAQVLVHRVQEAPAPDDATDQSGRFVEIDFTLTPVQLDALYEPGDISLSPADAGDDPDAPTFFSARVRLVADDEETQCDKLSGVAHLRIVYPVGQFKGPATFRYFFATFGHVEL